MWRALYGRVCLRYLASALTFRTRRSVGAPALVCVPRDIEDELAVADDPGEVDAVKLVLKLIMQSYVMASEPACARSAMVALVVEPLGSCGRGLAKYGVPRFALSIFLFLLTDLGATRTAAGHSVR